MPMMNLHEAAANEWETHVPLQEASFSWYYGRISYAPWYLSTRYNHHISINHSNDISDILI